MDDVISNEKLVLDSINEDFNVTSVLLEAYNFNHSDLNSIY